MISIVCVMIISSTDIDGNEKAKAFSLPWLRLWSPSSFIAKDIRESHTQSEERYSSS